MTELKTMKDIERAGSGFSNIKTGNLVFVLDLKQEAIKWLKSDKSNFYSREEMEHVKDWIRHFFNITDKEVKE
jgi:hypothetical protein